MQEQAANNNNRDSYIVQQVINNNDTDNNENTNTTMSMRRGKLLTLLGITGFNERNDGIVREGSLYTTVAAFLAWKELQGRSSAILPHLPHLLHKCPDLEWVYEARDTNFAPLQAAQQLLTAMGQHQQQQQQNDQYYDHDTMVVNNNNTNSSSSSTILVEPTHQPDHEVVIVTQEELQEIANATGSTSMTSMPFDQNRNETLTTTWPSTAPSTTTLFSPTTSPTTTTTNTTNSNSFSSRIPPSSITPLPRTLPPRETDPPLTEDQFVFQRGYSHNESNEQSHQQSASSSLSNNGNNGQQLETSSVSTNNNTFDNDFLRPFAMIGAFSSRVSETLSILGDALSVPQVSGSSTSADLNLAPLFARTIGTDDGQAEAFIHYMMHLGVTHVANIFIKDSYGTAFHQSLARHASDNGIRLRGIPYLEGQELRAIQSLQDTQYRYVYATIVGWESLVQTAFEQEVLGVSGYAWFLSEKFFLTYPDYEVPKEQPGLAHALSGIGLVNVHVASHEALNQAMDNFVTNTSLQQEYIASHAHPEIFDNFTFPPHTIHSNQYLYFDAVLALGLASCNTPGLFTGPELYENLLKLEFEGVTGNVSFDEHGNRAFHGLQYRIDNLRLNENRSDSLFFRFKSKLTAVVSVSNITQVNPFLFPDGAQGLTSHIPATLPPVEMDFKFIPMSARVVGYVLGSSIMMLSLATIAWTWRARKTHVIKAAQPPFLIQICFGTLVTASAVFPLSYEGGGQDEWTNPKKYNVACLSAMWLLPLGFVISVSAILAKTWRLNKVMHAGAAIRRIQIDAMDAMPPFVGLLTINVTMLLCLTLVAPYEFRRTNMSNYDHFERSLESYGHCGFSSNLAYAFLVPMIFVNTLGVFMAAIQLYKARNLPMDFSETRYLGLSMAFLLETFFLSAPVLIALRTIPTAYFLFATIAISFLCLTILVPVFLPKFLLRKSKKNQGKRALANLIAQHQNQSRASQFDAGVSSHAMAPQSRRYTNFDQAYSVAVGEWDGSDDNSNRSSRSSRSSYGMMKLHRKSKA